MDAFYLRFISVEEQKVKREINTVERIGSGSSVTFSGSTLRWCSGCPKRRKFYSMFYESMVQESKKMVLRRKTEEAAMDTKQLKESRKTLRDIAGSGSNSDA
ncbi:hypothetical protein HAX54_005099 [Datura stramonium]|uniref:Uncharacterized protein n=1 Tax=Datura stramonium TaxID=4076 RepID=A0ABS8T8W4_DATST|nr:hypothetical protein [Datura stramonium]